MQKPQSSEQLPERFPELMGTHMKDFHLPLHSRSVFQALGWSLCTRFSPSFPESLGGSVGIPKGPKTEKKIKILKFQARLRISSEPPTKPLFCVGGGGGFWRSRLRKFQTRLRISSEIENFKRDWKSLRAKGALISEPRHSTPLRDDFSHARKGKRPFQRKALFEKAVFPFSRGKNRISQGGSKSGLTN